MEVFFDQPVQKSCGGRTLRRVVEDDASGNFHFEEWKLLKELPESSRLRTQEAG